MWAYRKDPSFWPKRYRIDHIFLPIYIDITLTFQPEISLPVLFGGECPAPGGWLKSAVTTAVA